LQLLPPAPLALLLLVWARPVVVLVRLRVVFRLRVRAIGWAVW
jgi:hypothetical protein